MRVVLCCALALNAAEAVELILMTDMLPRPLGISSTPRFSWRPTVAASASMPRGTVQTSYHLQVASSITALEGGLLLWDHNSTADTSSLVTYGGPPLRPGGHFAWRVAPEYCSDVARADDRELALPSAPFSAPATFSTSPTEFAGEFVGLPAADPFDQASCPWLRSEEFELGAAVGPDDVALLYVGSVGFHEPWLNGAKASADMLSPQVADLTKRVPVRAYDVSALLVEGTNVVGLWLAVGWAAYRASNPESDVLFNTTAAPIAFAQLTLQRGAAPPATVLASRGGVWLAAPSDTTHLGLWQNSNFGGDRKDDGRAQADWAAAGGGREWAAAQAYPRPEGRALTTEWLEPNRLRERVGLADSYAGAAGFMLKFERVFAGHVSLRLRGTPGSTVAIRASSLPLCGDAFADAAAAAGRPHCVASFPEYGMQHELVLGAAGEGAFAPRFSYHEVQYLFVNSTRAPTDVVGRRVGNIAADGAEDDGGGRARVGAFASSSEPLNRIYDASIATAVNLVAGGMSVDCPHRERLGYLGDAHTTLELALANFNSLAFYEKWLDDMLDVQGYPAHDGGLCAAPDTPADGCGYLAHSAPTIDGGGNPGHTTLGAFDRYSSLSRGDLLLTNR